MPTNRNAAVPCFYSIKSNNDDGGMLKCLDLQIM